LLECLHRLRFHMHMDVDDQHRKAQFGRNRESSTPGNTDYLRGIVKGAFQLGAAALLP
jgi:hypothetical protein